MLYNLKQTITCPSPYWGGCVGNILTASFFKYERPQVERAPVDDIAPPPSHYRDGSKKQKGYYNNFLVYLFVQKYTSTTMSYV